jgi:hypothetical protein
MQQCGCICHEVITHTPHTYDHANTLIPEVKERFQGCQFEFADTTNATVTYNKGATTENLPQLS